MNLLSTRFMFIGMCILMNTPTILQGQNVFWSEDFSNGIPNNWTNYDVNNPLNSLEKWKWDDNPSKFVFFPQPPFAAATASNGFAYFDSDDYNFLHDTQLISSSIDCSNQSSVIIHFENQYDYFSNISQPTLEVSKDSINWSVNNLFVGHLRNHQRDHVQLIELDISNVAANEPTIYLRFRWIGQNEYIWRIDDIRLQDSFSPASANDLIIKDVALGSNFRTPLAHAKDIVLGGDVFNNGSQIAHNVTLTTSIIDTTTNILVYLDSTSISSIMPGNVELLGMSTDFSPTAEGKYKIYYDVKSDSSDQAIWDNQKIIPFEILSNNIFQKNFEFSSLDANLGGDEYEIGNIYQTQDSGHYAEKIYFTALLPPNAGPLLGRNVDVKLYEVPIILNYFLDSINTYPPVPIAFGSYTFTSSDQNKANLVGVEVLDLNGSKVLLKPNTRYLAMVSFTTFGNSNNVRIGLDDSWRYEFERSTVAFSKNIWYKQGFGAHLTSIVLLETSLSNNIAEKEQSSIFDNNVKLYPNPATEENLTVQFDLEKNLKQLEISINDITGKHFSSEIYQNVYKNEVNLNVKNYPKGVYLLTITTKSSEQITKIFVVK